MRSLRIGVTPPPLPQLIIGAGAVLSGETVTLDSSNITTTLSPDALLNAGSLQPSSGRISVLLDNSGTLQPQPGMILGGALLTGLRAADSLSLLSLLIHRPLWHGSPELRGRFGASCRPNPGFKSIYRSSGHHGKKPHFG
ncbi:MAG: hypothetical protein IPK32_08960 [Verrucomicrobiaceae bacterium]|nr:hypothetical protein [Verrucomicrobiaceae bacterium]